MGNLKEVPSKEITRYWLQVVAVSIGCLSVISDGLLAAWSSPFIVKIVNDKDHFNIDVAQASYFATIPPIGSIFSCILFAKFADIIGRKNTLLLVAIPQLLSWVLKAVATNVYIFYLSRLMYGVSFGCVLSVMPMYIGEVVSPQIRGVLGSFISSLKFFGQFLMNVIGNRFDVKTTSYICSPLVLLYFLLFVFMPESPYYLVIKNRESEAKHSLKRLLSKQNVDDEFEKLKKDVERQISEKGTWKDLVKIKSNRKAILIAMFLRITQQLGGSSVFMTTTQFIFENAGGKITSDVAAMTFTFLSFVLYFLSGFLVDKIGRRPAFITSMYLSGFILMSESIFFYIQDYHPSIDVSPYNWFPLAGMIAYLICASFGPGIIPTVMMTELFSTSIKVKATVVMMLFFSCFIFLAQQLFFVLYEWAGLFAPFLLFACSNIFGAIGAYFFLPETKGKTLEEIQQDLKGKHV